MVVITKVTEISPGVHRNTTSTQWVYIILLMILCSCENVTGAIPNLTRICTGIDIVLTSYEILPCVVQPIHVDSVVQSSD